MYSDKNAFCARQFPLYISRMVLILRGDTCNFKRLGLQKNGFNPPEAKQMNIYYTNT